jgi:hypothetical protein
VSKVIKGSQHRVGPRVGTFLVGAFAGSAAAAFPRLAVFLGTPAIKSSAVEMDVFRTSYVIASIVFAVLIGIGAMIWEWNTRSSPRQTLVAALGLPALFAGALNSIAISSNASRLGEDLQKITDQYADENGIRIESSESPLSRDDGGSLWDYDLVRSAYAERLKPEARGATFQKQGGLDLGVYRQRRYSIVLDTVATKQEADRKVQELGSKYGRLQVQLVDKKYAIGLEGSLPYSQAVSKAVDIKRMSGNSLSPTLVPAK